MLEIVGEKGSIIIPDFVLPFNSEPFWIPQNPYNEKSEYQIRDFNGQITSHEIPECLQVVELVRTFVRTMKHTRVASQFHKIGDK